MQWVAGLAADFTALHNWNICTMDWTPSAGDWFFDAGVGLNIGGKIAIARCGEHISVAIFFGIGLLHLNEMAIGLGHRVIYSNKVASEEENNES